MEENSSLWRSLVLPEETEDWKSEALDLFDEKSRSTLEEISIHTTADVKVDQMNHLKKFISKSRETLQSLWIGANLYIDSEGVARSILDLSLQLPRLTEFRFSIFRSMDKRPDKSAQSSFQPSEQPDITSHLLRHVSFEVEEDIGSTSSDA